jgi:hypothetical protein
MILMPALLIYGNSRFPLFAKPIPTMHLQLQEQRMGPSEPAIAEATSSPGSSCNRRRDRALRTELVLLGGDAAPLGIKLSLGVGAKRPRHFVDPRNVVAPFRIRYRTITRVG